MLKFKGFISTLFGNKSDDKIELMAILKVTGSYADFIWLVDDTDGQV
jgi:hypothetical protein